MLNHLIRTAKSHLGSAIQRRGSGGGLSGGFIMFGLKANMFQNKCCLYGSLVCPAAFLTGDTRACLAQEAENIFL